MNFSVVFRDNYKLQCSHISQPELEAKGLCQGEQLWGQGEKDLNFFRLFLTS